MSEVGVDTPLNFPKSPLPNSGRGSGGYVDTEEPRVVNHKGESVKTLYRPSDPPEYQPRPATLVSVKIFDLAKEGDLLEYEGVLNRVGQNPFVTIRYTERHWNEGTNSWKVLIEVCESVKIANSQAEN